MSTSPLKDYGHLKVLSRKGGTVDTAASSQWVRIATQPA